MFWSIFKNVRSLGQTKPKSYNPNNGFLLDIVVSFFIMFLSFGHIPNNLPMHRILHNPPRTTLFGITTINQHLDDTYCKHGQKIQSNPQLSLASYIPVHDLSKWYPAFLLTTGHTITEVIKITVLEITVFQLIIWKWIL